MENKMSKPYLAVSILLVALAPFVLFCIGLIPGIIYLVLGILSLIFAKKQNKIVIVILAIVGIILFLLTIALNSFITLIGQVGNLITDNYLITPNIINLYEQLMYLFRRGDFEYFLHLLEESDFIFNLLVNWNALITPVYAALTLPLVLLVGTSLFRGRVGNIIIRVFTCILASISAASLLKNTFIALFANLQYFNADNLLTFIVNAIIDGYDFEFIIFHIICSLTFESLMIYNLLALALPVFTFVCALIGPYGRCKKHE